MIDEFDIGYLFDELELPVIGYCRSNVYVCVMVVSAFGVAVV